jgi:hypothetical protein
MIYESLNTVLLPAEVAARLRISISTLRKLVHLGRIRCLVIGAGTKRPHLAFREEHILEYLRLNERMETPPPPPPATCKVGNYTVSTRKPRRERL